MRRGDSQTVSGSTEGSDENFRFRDCSLSPETPSATELLDRFHALRPEGRIVDNHLVPAPPADPRHVQNPRESSTKTDRSVPPLTLTPAPGWQSETDRPLTLTPAPGWRTRPIVIDVPSAEAEPEPQPELKPEPQPELKPEPAEPIGEQKTAKKAVRRVVCRWRIARQLDGGARIVRTRSRSPYFE